MRMQLASMDGACCSAVAFEAKLKEGDLYAMSNAIVMEVNHLAAQMFELFMMTNELVNVKSKRVFKILADQYQVRIENIYGEHILR